MVKQAVGSEVILSETEMTRFQVFHMLLTGSDYSRKMPQLGAGFVWENMHVSIPLLTCCTHDAGDDSGTAFQLDEQFVLRRSQSVEVVGALLDTARALAFLDDGEEAEALPPPLDDLLAPLDDLLEEAPLGDLPLDY